MSGRGGGAAEPVCNPPSPAMPAPLPAVQVLAAGCTGDRSDRTLAWSYSGPQHPYPQLPAILQTAAGVKRGAVS